MKSSDVERLNAAELTADGVCSATLEFDNAPEWLVWQVSDSAFPTGGFAHSAGLEAAWQHGEVKNRGELISFVETSLRQLGRAALPFVTAAHNEPGRLGELDELCDAFTINHVANRASRAQGKAFLTAVQRIFAARESSVMQTGKMTVLRFHHFPGVFGAALKWLEFPLETTGRLFFFNHLRAIMAAAVRLNIVGPMEAQILQHRLSATAQEVVRVSASFTLDDIAQTAPLLDIWQGAQDRLYSRLFQS